MIGDPLTPEPLHETFRTQLSHKTMMNGKSLTIVEVLLNVKVDIDEYNSISINM